MTFTPTAPPTVAVEVAVSTTATLIATVTGNGNVFNSGQQTLYVGGSGVTPTSFTTFLLPGQMYTFAATGSFYAIVAAGVGQASVATWPAFSGGGGGSGNLINGVTQFGLDNTGTLTDNSTIFNAALLTCANEQATLYLPPGTYNFTNPIQMGNGTTSTNSTNPMGDIQGGGDMVFAYMGGQVATNLRGSAVLKWTGSGGVAFVNINGPVQFGSIRNVYLWGNSVCSNGINANGAQFCTFENIVVDSFTNIHVQINPASNTNNTGAQNNSMMNIWRHICINMLQNTSGLYFGSVLGGGGHGNTCFELVEKLAVVPPATASSFTHSVVFGACDTCTVRESWFPTVSTNENSLLFVTSIGFIPGSNLVDQCEMINSGGATAVAQSGASPMVWVRPNTVRPTNDNGTIPSPQMVGVIWQSPIPLGFLSGNTNITFGSAYTNNSGVPVTIYPTAGTVTGVSINGVGGIGIAGPWRVPVGSSITIAGTGTLNTGILGD